MPLTIFYLCGALFAGEVVENEYLKIQYDLRHPSQPLRVTNKRTGDDFELVTSAPELTFSEGVVGGAGVLPFRAERSKTNDARHLILHYPRRTFGGIHLDVRTIIALPQRSAHLRKWVELDIKSAAKPAQLTLEKVILLDQAVPHMLPPAEGWQSYPAFTDQLFFGVEFPVAQAVVRDGRLALSHAPGSVLDTPKQYRSRSMVIGACPRGKVRETFERYVMSLRPRHGKLHFDYNSWWTSPVPYSQKDITRLIELFHDNLYRPHGVSFDTFTIDLGWSAREGVWAINKDLFAEGFAPLNEALDRQKSHLGLWWSPSNHYSPHSFDSEWAHRKGFETLLLPKTGHVPERRVACLAQGTRYQAAAKDAMVQLVKQYNLDMVKFDGYHYQCSASEHGHLPDDLSREAIAQGLIDIFEAMRQANPDMWMEPTCFGFDPSPWWLQWADSVIGAFGDDAPRGTVPAPVYRESYTTSRDFYNLHSADSAFPVATQEVLGIIHQTPDPLYNDAVMAVMRGHQFISLYLNPKYLQPVDYAFLAQLMTWARAHAPLLSHTKMLWPRQWREHGPAPIRELKAMPRQTYGYAHWGDDGGLVCLRNPWIAVDPAELVLDETTLGAEATSSTYVACQLYPYRRRLATGLKYGQTLNVSMGPYETKVISLVNSPDSAVSDAEPMNRQMSFARIGEVQSEAVEITYETSETQPFGRTYTVRPASVSMQWNTSIQASVRDAGWRLYYLIESPSPAATLDASIQINGASVQPQTLDSETGWSASGPQTKQNAWKWYIVPVPAGTWDAQSTIEVEPCDITVSAWLMRAFDPPTPAEKPAGLADAPAFPVCPDYSGRVSVGVIALQEHRADTLRKLTRPRRVETIPGIYLDCLEPKSVEQGWGTLQKNRSVAGHPLQIGSRRFDRGIGTHSPAKLVYDLGGRYEHFHGFVGQDAAAHGTIAFEIWADDTKSWESELMKRGDEPKEIHIPVQNVRTLTIVVTDGGDNHTADHADLGAAWLEQSAMTRPGENPPTPPPVR